MENGTSSTIIVCGLGWLGWPVLEFLKAAGWNVVAIDLTASPTDPRLGDAKLIHGDFRNPEILDAAGIQKAKAILILTNDDLTNLTATLAVRRKNKDIQIVMRMFNQTLLNQLRHTVSGITALSTSALTGPLFASVAMTGESLGVFDSVAGRRQILELEIEQDNPLIGRKLREIDEKYSKIRFFKPDQDENFAEDHQVRVGDRYLLCAEPEQLTVFQQDINQEAPVAVRWASFLWRWMRTLRQTWIGLELPVKISAVTLFLVMMMGSLFFWLDGLVKSWPRGLLRTVSVMVTSADLREHELETPFEQFVVSFLKFAGIILTAAFTALLTNYLVRMRLAGIFALRQIPESGHIVLCGLGTVGMRTLEELRKYHAEVVVIERNEQSRFITAARQFGGVVLMGDATLKQTLQRARAEKAVAVIACTSNDLINIEVTLLARELNPHARLIARMDDPDLAMAVRETANIRYSLSMSQMAAPAFVASLYQDKILLLFLAGGQLWSALEVKIQPGDKVLYGRTVRQAAVQYHFKPVHLIREGKERTFNFEDEPLMYGDQMLVLCPIQTMERFIRIETESAFRKV